MPQHLLCRCVWTLPAFPSEHRRMDQVPVRRRALGAQHGPRGRVRPRRALRRAAFAGTAARGIGTTYCALPRSHAVGGGRPGPARRPGGAFVSHGDSPRGASGVSAPSSARGCSIASSPRSSIRRLFPALELGYQELGQRAPRLGAAVRAARAAVSRVDARQHRRDCGAFPLHLGLPMAEVPGRGALRAVAGDARPPSRVAPRWRARALRPLPGFRQAALRLLEALHRRVGAPGPARCAGARHSGARQRRWRRELGLTDRQAEVLARLVGGASNKEIASELDCAENTVEGARHASYLRRSRVDSRALLIAKFWTTGVSAASLTSTSPFRRAATSTAGECAPGLAVHRHRGAVGSPARNRSSSSSVMKRVRGA